MARASTNQDSFLGGEISPISQGRVTIPKYKECLAICQNYVPITQGPKTRRPGTTFVARTRASNAHSRLIPFSFSTTENYIIEFCGGTGFLNNLSAPADKVIRFYLNGAPLLRSLNEANKNQVINVTAATNASPIQITGGTIQTGVGTTFNVVGQSLYAQGFVGMEELNGRDVVIKSVTIGNPNPTVVTLAVSSSEGDQTGVLNLDSTSYGTYVSGGTLTPYFEIPNPYADADLDALQFAQSDDVIYIVHPKYMVRKLVRGAAATTGTNPDPFTIASVSFVDGPYLENIGTDILGPSLGSTMNWTTGSGAIVFAGQGPFFTDADANISLFVEASRMVIRAYTGTVWLWGYVTHVPGSGSSANVAQWYSAGSFNAAAPGSFSSTSFRIGAWKPSTGFPTTVVFYQDRLVFGGATLTPSRFDGSDTADYENFTPTDGTGNITAANAYSFVLASQDFNKIQWMTSDERGLLMGTSAAEWVVTGATSTAALSPLSVSANKVTSSGGAAVQASQLGRSSLYVQRGNLKVRELQPTLYTTNGFDSNDLTEYAEHITQTGLILFGVQKVPQPIFWAVRKDGVLISMTYDKKPDATTVGWARHVIGGVSSAVESLAIVPGTTDDQVYVEVKRTIGGKTLRYIEYITPFFKTYDTRTTAFFVDSGLTYSGSPTTTISGLNHLNGQALAVLGDGGTVYNGVTSSITPVNGRITLPASYSVVTIGFPYYSQGQKLRSDAGAADGTAMGKTRRTNRVGFNLVNTQAFQFGPDFTTLDTVTLDSSEAGTLGVSPELFTGITTQILAQGYDFDNKFCWQQYEPLPGTIIGIFPDLETQDR